MATRIIPSRDLVSQESIQFIREQILTITLAEFRPNSRVHVFFDGVNVDQYCATYGNAIGTAIYSDIRGKASIMFSVPANTFNTGVREVVLTESANLSSISIAGTQFVTAKTQFNANGTKQIFQNKEKTIVTVDRIIPIQAQDPLAQSFFTYGITGGAFLSSIDLYFFSKDPVLPVRVEIRAMENGYPAKLDPDNTHHISIVEPNMVATSSDASIATKFVFDPPIYMKEDNDYCFVVRSNSDKYNLFTSKMGERSLEDDTIISQQPYIGSLFKSENNITWVAEQFEDIKFTLNKAVFETNTPGIIKLRAVYPWTRAESTHFSTTSGSNVITYSGGYDHGLEVGSKIGVYAETGLVFNGIPSSQFSGTKTVTAVLDRKTVTFTTTSAATATGTIISGGKVNQLFISEGGENYSLSDSISIIGGGGSGATASMVLTDGVITSVTITNPGTGYTSDPYVVVLTSTGTGAKIIANVAPFMSVQTNKPVSMIVPRVPVYNYGSSSNTMIMNTTLGNYEGGNLTTYAPGNYIALRNGIPHTLDQASVIANLSNEQTFMSGNPSCEIEVRFTTDNPNV